MRSMPNVCSAAMNGGWLKMPLVVIQTCSTMVWLGSRFRWPISARRSVVEARQHHRQHLAHVTDDHLELGMLVERPGHHHAKDVDRHLRMPAPARGGQHAVGALRQTGVVGLADVRRRHVGVDVDRHVELDRRREQAVIARVVEEAAFGRCRGSSRRRSFRSFTARLSSSAQASGLPSAARRSPRTAWGAWRRRRPDGR